MPPTKRYKYRRSYIMRIVVFVVVLLLPVSSFAHNFVILPEAEFIKVQDLFSRPNVEASSGWRLTLESVVAVEEDFRKLDDLSVYGKKYVFSSYFKQYLGIILNGKQYIYVNALKHKRMSWQPSQVFCHSVVITC
jgi:hypothetical protein